MTHLNMLPLAYRRQQILRRRLLQWSAAWGLSLVLVVIVAWFQAAECRRLRAAVDLLEAKYARVEDLRTKLGSVRQELQLIEQQEAVVLELSQQRPILTLLGTISQAAHQCDQGVSVRRVSWSVGEGGGKQTHAAPQQPSLILQGVGLDNLAVARFASALRASEMFQVVKLKSIGEETVNGHQARTYEVECLVY